MSQPKYGQIINCGLTILIVSLFSLSRLRNTTQLRLGTVDKSKWPVFLQNASGNPTCNHLGTPWGEEFSERGPIFLNYVQHIFPGGKKIFFPRQEKAISADSVKSPLNKGKR